MCGILGQINFNNTFSSHPNLNLLQHRGPDGSGEWVNKKGNIYFGHTRLAILEPTPAGRQPMNDSSTRFTITFNGEIYNHLRLRAVLPGIKWNGTSDTETLIELIAHKGLDTIHHLKGMFAFALYDSIEDSVLLVRDRFGIKPLWFKNDQDRFIFSSEIRPLAKNHKTTLNKKALSEYIGFGRMPNTTGIFEKIEAVTPGGWVKVLNNGTIKKGCWWTGCSLIHRPIQNREECKERVHKLVSDAVREHLISDVGVGSFLSGGIDSSIITLVAGKVMGRKLKTFTVGFPNGAKDERLIARVVAKKVGTEHNEIEVDEETCLKWVKEAVLNLDLPSVDAVNTFIVSKAVTDSGLKVALSGLGGDELFGGYPSFKNVARLMWLNKLPSKIRNLIIKKLSHKLREKFDGVSLSSLASLTIAYRRFTSIEGLKNTGLCDGTPVIPAAPKGLDEMSMISWAEMQGYMIPMLLRDSDQMSMAKGLEIRVPFLDHALVEEVLHFPEKYKKGKNIKPLLVDAFRKDLPVEVYERPKQGFVLPMDLWIRGPLSTFTEEGIYAAAEILGLWEPLHQKEKFDKRWVHWTRVWNWCVLGHWLVTQKIAVEKLSEIPKISEHYKERSSDFFANQLIF
jgi:asparagine synthase (glutamine-hydrolysing)